MTVLVDEARWWWRGARWAHLVSDRSHDELHEFARRLGKRRLGFQGDHYDVDELDRTRALALGAEVVDSRELVRRLRAAGLRDRAAKPAWERVAMWPVGVPLAPLDPVFGDVLRALALERAAEAAEAGLYRDPHRRVLLVDLAPGVEIVARPGPGSPFTWIGEPRADGRRSVEIFVTR